MRTGGAQQLGRQRGRGAELAGQVEHRRTLRQRETHDQAEFAGHAGRGDLVQDLRQLLGAVEHEVAHAMPRPRLADRAACLDRVHEMDRGVGEHLPHQRDLGDRGAVEMRDAAGMERAQHRRLRVALHRVQHVAGKRLHERVRGRANGGRAQAVHRLLRALDRDQFIDRWQRCAAAGKRRRSGETAVRTRRVFMAISSQTQATENRERAGAARNAPRRRTQPMLRGLRIAANRSANIGGSLTTPAPRWTGPTEKDALRRCCAPGFRRGARGTCDASSNRLTQWGEAGRAHIEGYGGASSYAIMDGEARTQDMADPISARYSQTIGRRGQRGDLRHVVGGRDLHHVHADERDAAQPAQDRLRLP